MPRKLVANSHQEAYDLWASEFDDPALMANRDAATTRRKLARVAESLALDPSSRVLDVGPGDGALFRHIAGRVATCWGVDPSAAAVEKLRGLFGDVPNVSFEIGSANTIPFPDDSFDVVVVNSVLQILMGLEEVERALGEMVRVCRPGGLVFVGELPFRSELSRGLLVHLGRKLREFGVRNFARTLVHTYLRPLLRGEPIVLYPATSLHATEETVRAMGERLGASVECRRHRELARPSTTRNDYWLTLFSDAAAP